MSQSGDLGSLIYYREILTELRASYREAIKIPLKSFSQNAEAASDKNEYRDLKEFRQEIRAVEGEIVRLEMSLYGVVTHLQVVL